MSIREIVSCCTDRRLCHPMILLEYTLLQVSEYRYMSQWSVMCIEVWDIVRREQKNLSISEKRHSSTMSNWFITVDQTFIFVLAYQQFSWQIHLSTIVIFTFTFINLISSLMTPMSRPHTGKHKFKLFTYKKHV